ncbi:GAF domain-containing protein [Winogradskyella sp. A3E31]|uniref:GAF domain-containing protein n=1 Tax=Winogradskyella sp. A3E31 TaxID=3349637 RepID=UPI00398A6159
MDFTNNIDSPLNVKLSFNKLLSKYEVLKDSQDSFMAKKAKEIIRVADENPILRDGFTDIKYLEELKNEIQFILQDCFSEVLTENEIKTATIPFQNVIFNESERFKSILNNAGKEFELKIKNMPDDDAYVIAGMVILNVCYGYGTSFKRPYYYEIPNDKGLKRYYKILYNADFIEIEPSEDAPKITQSDYEELIDNYQDLELWKRKIPPFSYNFRGFAIANMVDVTDDQSISNIKSNLIGDVTEKNQDFINDLHQTFRSLYDIDDIEVGFSVYNEENDTFETVYGEKIDSYLTDGTEENKCASALCDYSYKKLLKEKELIAIADIDKAYKKSNGKAPQHKILKKAGFKSAILAPIANNDHLLGVMELVSKQKGALNSINANKLQDVMPFVIMAVERSRREEANLIEAIIQQECTSIHPSVHWKFKDEAKDFIKTKFEPGEMPTFKKISFENVYPLFGQIDVKGSSDARNTATQKDLSMQLSMAGKIIDKAMEVKKLPILEQTKFQIKTYNDSLKNEFKVDSEHSISLFLREDVRPVLDVASKFNTEIEEDLNDYLSKIDDELDVIYFYRKHYDDTIKLINKNMSTILDHKQIEAQKMYPHFFERFKTDGVEHNMYIGESITKHDSFNDVYLYNLRLWQLQVMCEMENEFYQNQHEYPVGLDVASMVLVFNQPLSIRFRMDEKRFDVDGTYNARYEVVKKRVDKAFIKGTEERITEKGKLTIVYSQKEDEQEYERYIRFLQSKKSLDTDLEFLELEDLQGVTGLKALRVSILYHSSKDDSDYYTYDDLMETIKS